MTNERHDPAKPRSARRHSFADDIGAKAARKVAARNAPTRVWSGLGVMGLVGWSVAVPTLLGTALGSWLDRRHPAHAWTLALLMGGLALGCVNAWHWVVKEENAPDDEGGRDE